jgi:hypothetical protein
MEAFPMKITPVGILCFTLLLAGCETGYRKESGTWVYVHWNEAQGRVSNKVEGADSTTLTQLSDSDYAKDRYHVYREGSPIKNADPASFERISKQYWKDRRSVYYYGKPIPGADPRTFRSLGHGYWSRDNKNVYVATRAVNPKNIATFRVINEDWAKDSQWYYCADGGAYRPIKELDYSSFEILKGFWARDRYRVYWASQVVEGGNPRSFKAISDTGGVDGLWYYSTGSRIRTVQEQREHHGGCY